jgi:exodeoxyribonuclease V alpha subunit
MESIDGVISRIVFHKPSKYSAGGQPFCIARLANGLSVKGNMLRPVEGEAYRFWGEMKSQKGDFGQAFEFHSYEPIVDERSADGVASYLAAHVDGIGRAKAAKLVEHFGPGTLPILRAEPGRALEVAGITAEIVESIKAHFADSKTFDPVAYAKLLSLFSDIRLPKRVIEGLLKTYGSSAPEEVTRNPYILCQFPRVGWKTVDAFAISKAGYDPSGIERHEAAVLESLERFAADGHTAATEGELSTLASDLLGQRLDPAALDGLIRSAEVVETSDDHGHIYQIAALAMAEATIAAKLSSLAETGKPLAFDLADPAWVMETGLGGDQAAAVRIVADNPVSIISGPPGTGKSYTLSRLLGRMVANGVSGIRVTAPTGKAAKRAAELLAQVPGCEDIPSTTVHRALAPQPNEAPAGIPTDDARFGRGREEFGFGRNEACPLDDQVVVVDETSMLDVRLLASLLNAIKPGTRLIFVGDHNQLPSVGPGSVLRDMMAAGVPTAVLEQIRRSDGGGTVVRACHAIKDGLIPDDADEINLPTQNWIHIEIADPHDIAAKIVELHSAPARTFDRVWDRQVVTPQKQKLAFACDNLNRLLSAALNPQPLDGRGGSGSDDSEEGGPDFRPGDKVVRVKNGIVDELVEWSDQDDDDAPGGKAIPDLIWDGRSWFAREIPVVNGDMGTVEGIVETRKGVFVIVRFRDPDRLCRLAYAESKIISAYAMTCHKAQGSGFPYVIVPVHHAFYWDAKREKGIFNREWIYTAISRAEKLLVTVGQWSAIEAAVGRKTVHKRRTTLERRLGEMWPAGRETEANEVEAVHS